MTDPFPLRPARDDEISQAIGHALRFDGRKRIRHADDLMARITAEHLLAQLARSGFVIMKRPSSALPSTSHHGLAPGGATAIDP